MACEKIKVCHNTRCKNQGSPLVIQDIEELVQGQCPVVKCGCLGKCGEGPNVEIEVDGVPHIHSDLSTYQNVLHFVDEIAEIEVNLQVIEVGQHKYDARHTENHATRLKLTNACIEKVTKELKGSSQQPKLMADLLVMRSQDLLSEDPPHALTDASNAVELAPKWPQALLALARACEESFFPGKGLQAARDALKLGSVFDKAEVKKMISRLQPLAKEEKDYPDKYKKLRGDPSSPKLSVAGKTEIVQAPIVNYPSNIYAKMGGRPKFKELAYEVHAAMFKDPLTSFFFPPTMDNARITERNVDFLVGAFGGPKYVGPDMVITHEFLRITDEQYTLMVNLYKIAVERMKLHDMFKVPIMRQLEGMRGSIVYRKDRPGPLARSLGGGHLQMHKQEVKREKDKKEKERAARKEKERKLAKEAAQKEALDKRLAEEATKAIAKAKAKAKGKAKAKAKPKAIEEPLEDGKGFCSSAISDATTAYTLGGGTLEEESSGENVVAPADTAENEECCPASGKTLQEAIAAGATCPFMLLLGQAGSTPRKVNLRQKLLDPLEDGTISLVDPQADPSSPQFGVVAM